MNNIIFIQLKSYYDCFYCPAKSSHPKIKECFIKSVKIS